MYARFWIWFRKFLRNGDIYSIRPLAAINILLQLNYFDCSSGYKIITFLTRHVSVLFLKNMFKDYWLFATFWFNSKFSHVKMFELRQKIPQKKQEREEIEQAHFKKCGKFSVRVLGQTEESFHNSEHQSWNLSWMV